MNPPAITILKHLLKQQNIGVLATQSKDFPYANLVAYVATDDLKSILFATLRTTQKYQNLHTHRNVSFLIDNRTQDLSDFSEAATVTALGVISEVDKQQYQDLFLSKHQQLSEFLTHPECVMIKITVEKFILVTNFQQVITLNAQDF